MTSTVPKKSSSLLDALDNSFISPPAELLPQTPPRSQNLNTINAYFQPKGSGTGGLRGIQNDFGNANARDVHGWDSGDDTDEANNIAELLSPRKRQSTGGFRLNYETEAPVLGIDRGGPDQRQKMAEFVTHGIDNVSHGLTVASARKKLGLKDAKDLVPGMEVRLLPHQAIGVAWMVAKETGPDKGGIMADDMGLGKTVQMIATMVKNPARTDDECKTTIIIVPAALLQQWKDEVENKTNGMFTVHIHHGSDKLKKKSDINKYDVIVTTYHTLMNDFRIPKDVDGSEAAEWLSHNGGILARVKFYRAVADEAQYIRNRATRASISLAHIRARYRWMLTGTPVTNTLADIYGLLRFGRFRPWNDWDSFNTHIAKIQLEDAPLAGSRTQAILQPILLRRTKNSFIEGEPILQLPPKTIDLVQVQFSEDERDLYNSFEARSKVRLNKFIRERTLVKNHAAVLVMILRMRQLCCHPNLILSQAEEYEDPSLLMAGEGEKELGRARKIMGATWVHEVKQKFLTRALATEVLDFSDEADTAQATCPVCKDILMGEGGRVLACTHEICFDCSLNLSQAPIEHDGIFGEGSEKANIAAEKAYEEAAAKGHRPCPTCKKMVDLTPNKVFKFTAFEPTDEELSNHARAMRRARIQNRDLKKRGSNGLIKTGSPSPAKPLTFEERGMDDSDDDLPDVSTMLDIRPTKKAKTRVVNSEDEDDDDMMDLTLDQITVPLKDDNKKCVKKGGSDDSDDDDIEIVSFTPRKKASKTPPTKNGTKGKAKANTGDGPSQDVIDTWKRGDDDMEPSSKMLVLMEMLEEWEASGDKTIVYSQWTSMLDLVETLFSKHGIQSLRFDGRMDQPSRRAVLSTFQNPGGPKVILISTKCGGVGLNLVSANRIVNLDLSWNYASESQAYDRVHRIGQEKEVFIKRLVIENTIEERMLKLQDVKVGLAEAALGEGTGMKLHKLSVKDIKYLFGMAPAKKD